MMLAHKIFIGFFLAYGFAQAILNGMHLFGKNGLKNARKQHGEIPKTASENEIKAKALGMFISGVSFLIIGLLALVNDSFLYQLMLIMLIANTVYILIEAIYYNYWKTYCACGVAGLVLALFLIFT